MHGQGQEDSFSSRRGLHRSNSVQTLGSSSGVSATSGGSSRSLSDVVGNGDGDSGADGIRKERNEEKTVEAGDDEEDSGMLQHFQRARRRHSLNMNDTMGGISRNGSSRRVASRRNLLHRTNSAQNISSAVLSSGS